MTVFGHQEYMDPQQLGVYQYVAVRATPTPQVPCYDIEIDEDSTCPCVLSTPSSVFWHSSTAKETPSHFISQTSFWRIWSLQLHHRHSYPRILSKSSNPRPWSETLRLRPTCTFQLMTHYCCDSQLHHHIRFPYSGSPTKIVPDLDVLFPALLPY